jgi:hypothetical protein
MKPSGFVRTHAENEVRGHRFSPPPHFFQIWDLVTLKTRHTLVGHGGIVHAVVVVGRKLISGSSDKTIRVPPPSPLPHA